MALAWLTGPESPAHAQPQSLGQVSFEHVPSSTLNNAPPGELEVRVSKLRVGVALPIPLRDNRLILLSGLGYTGWLPDVTAGNPNTTPSDFHEIALTLGAIVPLPPKWVLVGQLLPSLATDFDDIDQSHLRIAGTVLGMHRFSDRMQAGLGVIATYDFGQFLPLPALSLNWEPTSTVRVNVFIPAFARVAYTVHPRFEIGLAARVDGGRFSVQVTDPQVDNVRYSLGHAGAFTSIRLFSRVWLTSYVGYTLFRRFDAFNGDNDKLLELSLDRAPVVRLLMEFRLPQPPRQSR